MSCEVAVDGIMWIKSLMEGDKGMVILIDRVADWLGDWSCGYVYSYPWLFVGLSTGVPQVLINF
jgi:hypothetical protein